MTGKEALKEIRLVRVYIDEFGCAVPLKKVKEYKIIENELDELTKYKRAFELCTRLIHIDNNIEFGGDAYWIGDIERVSYITKEEYELLEELMDNENS